MKSRSHDDLAAKGLFCGTSCVSILFVFSSGNSFYGIICALKVDSQVDFFGTEFPVVRLQHKL